MQPSYLVKNIRASAVLTTSHVAATTLSGMHEYNQLVVLVKWTKGSLTSLEIKVEFSNDNTVFFQETNASTSAGTTTLTLNEYTTTAEGNYEIAIPISCEYVKVSAKGTGTVTNSLLVLDAVMHTV